MLKFKLLGRLALITFIFTNGIGSSQLFGMQDTGEKKPDIFVDAEPSSSTQSQFGHFRSNSELSLEGFAAEFREEEAIDEQTIEESKTYPHKQSLDRMQDHGPQWKGKAKAQIDSDEEDARARLEFAKQTKILPDGLVKSLIDGCPEKLKTIIETFEYRELAQDGLPKAIILVGEPGVGKSDLSRAIAQHLGFDIEFIRAPYLGDEFRKSSEKDLRKIFDPLFRNATKPIFVVFDELQAITAAHKDNDREANVGMAFWSLIDKYIDEANIYIIGTINKEEDLPGQLKRRAQIVEISLPDAKARKAILEHHLYNLKNMGSETKKGTIIDPSCQTVLEKIAKKAVHFTGSDMYEIAARKSIQCAIARSKQEGKLNKNMQHLVVTKEDLQHAFEMQSLEVYKRRYPQGRFYWMNWKNAGTCVDHLLPVASLAAQIHLSNKGLAAQNKAFKYQRIVTMLSFFRNIWTTFQDSECVEVLRQYENDEIPREQRISHPSLDLNNTNYKTDGVINTVKHVPWGVGEFAAKTIHVTGQGIAWLGNNAYWLGSKTYSSCRSLVGYSDVPVQGQTQQNITQNNSLQ